MTLQPKNIIIYMNKKDSFLIFSISLILSFIFWRLWIHLFHDAGEVSILRQVTGLNIHHYHYGIILVLIATLILIFYKSNNYSIAIAGLGFGTYFDGFISRLFKNSTRSTEILNYNNNLLQTSILFTFLISITIIFYIVSERYKN